MDIHITPAYDTVEGVHEGAHFAGKFASFRTCECGTTEGEREYAGCNNDGTLSLEVIDKRVCRECGRVWSEDTGRVEFRYDVTDPEFIRACNVFGLELAGM